MKSRFTQGILCGILTAIVVAMCSAWTIHPNDDTLFQGPALFMKVLNVQTDGSFQIAGTAVTSTAAELNILDGCTATYAQLNAAASGNIAIGRITNALGSAGSYIGGNVPVAAITNAAGSVGASIGGNIPVAAITNAAGSVGASIGGNIPIAAITNAIAETVTGYITNTCIAATGQTNTYVFAPVGGRYVLHSITTSAAE